MGFWERVGKWFLKFFENLGSYFVDNETTEEAIHFSGLEKAVIIILLILISFFIIKFIGFLLKKLLRIGKNGNQMDISAKSFFVSLIKALLWLLVAFVVVNILGLDLGSFAGILSAITVALGLALQDLIASFASGLILINSKNFSTGDYIRVTNAYGTVEGSVERIYFFVTALKTVDGQRVIISNNNVLKSNITNFSTFPYRRFNFMVTVSYDSDITLVKNTVLEILNSIEDIDHEEKKPDVHIGEFGDYGIQIAVKGYTRNESYWPTYNNLREKILIAFREKKINMPITTVTVVKGKSDDETEK